MHKCFFFPSQKLIYGVQHITCKDNNVGFSLFLFSPMWTKCFLFKSILYAMQVQCLDTSIAYFRLHGVNITSNNVIIHGVEIQMSPSNLMHDVQNLNPKMNDVILVQRELKWTEKTKEKKEKQPQTELCNIYAHVEGFFPFFFLP